MIPDTNSELCEYNGNSSSSCSANSTKKCIEENRESLSALSLNFPHSLSTKKRFSLPHAVAKINLGKLKL